MKKYISHIIILAIGVLLGWLLFGGSDAQQPDDHKHEASVSAWTCSMHPQIRQPEAGDCPICGMDLIPVGNDDASGGNAMEVKMSATAMQLAGVQTALVSRGSAVKEVGLNGKIQADERSIFSQTSHIGGRVERLLVTYTGEAVRKGQVLAYVYSPELITAQKELFEAEKMKAQQPALFNAAKEKLKNWKLTDNQIDDILKAGTPTENFPILADWNGIVLSKKVNLGDHIRQGETLFEVANLSNVWVLFDVYERDLAWVKVGSEIEYTAQSFPAEIFKGKISFIDPIINPKTRTAKARVSVQNAGLRFKPEMFVKGTLSSVLKGKIDVISIPKSAVMWTGERSVVYVKSSSDSGVGFLMREVTLGESLGDSYLISKGLDEGEEIAVHGTFSIDAAAQLAGKPSMMNREQAGLKIAIGKDAEQSLQALLNAYFELKDALVADDLGNAKQKAIALQKAYGNIKMSFFKDEAHQAWMAQNLKIKKAISELAQSEEIKKMREGFLPLSAQMIEIAKVFQPLEQVAFIQYCPMADSNKGANWLSLEREVLNPYFGKAMLKCGEVKGEIR